MTTFFIHSAFSHLQLHLMKQKNVMRFASSLHRQGAISFNSVILVQKDYINQIDSLCKSSSRFMKFLDEIFENVQW